jgi:hypothetical protein
MRARRGEGGKRESLRAEGAGDGVVGGADGGLDVEGGRGGGGGSVGAGRGVRVPVGEEGRLRLAGGGRGGGGAASEPSLRRLVHRGGRRRFDGDSARVGWAWVERSRKRWESRSPLSWLFFFFVKIPVLPFTARYTAHPCHTEASKRRNPTAKSTSK